MQNADKVLRGESCRVKKVGIYSGTFDPIHNGHIAFALEAAQQCNLDKVFFLTEPRPRRKQGIKAFEHRTAMITIAIQDYNQLGSVVLNQARFTPRETMPVLLERFKGAELYMLMGDDLLDHFASSDWPHIEELVQNIKFIIGVRKYDEKQINSMIKTLEQVKGLKIKYKLFYPTKYEISSSQIKSGIKRRHNYEHVDPRVADYIRANGLYSLGEK